MTVRARHGPFQNLVACGEAKLSLHISVATEAEIRLFRLEKFWRGRSFMDLMAVITAHRRKFVGSSSGFEESSLPLMALQASLRTFFGVSKLEGEDEAFPFLFGVLFPRAMTGLTSLSIWRDLGIFVSPPVGAVLLEGLEELRMAALAGFCSHISRSLVDPFLLGQGGKTDQDDQGKGSEKRHHSISMPAHGQFSCSCETRSASSIEMPPQRSNK